MRGSLILRSFEPYLKVNGGGGENRTRVQKCREAGLYKLSLTFPQCLAAR